MKYIPALLLILSVGLTANGQNSGVSHAFHWRCGLSGNTTFNFNPAIQTGDTAVVFDSLPYAKDYTLIMVCKPLADGETALWHLSFGDNASRGLTTERILSDSVDIRYAWHTAIRPAISTLRQTAPDSTDPYVRLAVGGVGGFKVAEVLYYPVRIGNTALRKVQSCLALRYGVTLGPVDYIDGGGRCIWEYSCGGAYHHRVTGVGRDTSTGLCQFRSRSEMDGAVLTIAVDSIGDGEFLVVGDDDGPMVFAVDGSAEVLGRSWKARTTSTERRLFSLVFDTRDFAMPGDSLALLVDRDIYLPSGVSGDSVLFEGVEFHADSCLFTLGRGGFFWQTALAGGGKGSGRLTNDVGGDVGTDVCGPFTARVYPNPSGGHYTIEVGGASQVRVTVYNVHGVVMASFSASGGERHLFEGDLPSGNAYYATVVTENGSQTLKLSVK